MILDEWGTSKPCHRCLNPVVLYKNRVIRKNSDGTSRPARMSVINSVIRCSSNECSLCCLDRDINASKNILHLLHLQMEGRRRPRCFSPTEYINEDDTP